MHYTGTIWRPPYESASLLLEVTAGCTHHRCKFCTLYADLPFPFRKSPLADIESDLREVQVLWHDPRMRAAAKLQGLAQPEPIRRTFLTGANPFALPAAQLLEISRLIGTYIPTNRSIGCFARVTDITRKSDTELLALRQAGYDGLTLGIETGDDTALRFMNKGYLAADIVTQCKRLEQAEIRYSVFYLAGISGAGRGDFGARQTAEICNQLHPQRIGANMLTVYPESALYQEMQHGTWAEESETEKYQELRILIESLSIPTIFAAMGASNAVPLYGRLPQEKGQLLYAIDSVLSTFDEEQLRQYRTQLPHL